MAKLDKAPDSKSGDSEFESRSTCHGHVAQSGRGAGFKIQRLRVRIPPWLLGLGSPTGRGAGFKIRKLWVRVPP